MLTKSNFLGTASRTPEILKSIYRKKIFFDSTTIPTPSPAIDKSNYIMPEITVRYNAQKTSLLYRDSSISRLVATKSSASYKSISSDSIFQGDKLRHVLISSDNSLDNHFFVQSAIYEWANDRLWQDFEYVFSVDLSYLIDETSTYSLSPTKSFSYAYIAKIIYDSLGPELSQDQILDVITKKPLKTVIIIEDYEKLFLLAPLRVKQFLSLFSKHNILITSIESYAYKEDGNLVPRLQEFYLDMALTNEGYSPATKHQYLKSVFNNQLLNCNAFIKFLQIDDGLLELSKSPSILGMLAHIWQTTGAQTITQVYSKLYVMLNQLDESYKATVLIKSPFLALQEAMEIEKALLTSISYNVMVRIHQLQNNPENIKILKFIVGLLSINTEDEIRETTLTRFLNILIASAPIQLKIGGKTSIIMFMHLFGEIQNNGYSLSTEHLEYIEGLLGKGVIFIKTCSLKYGFMV